MKIRVIVIKVVYNEECWNGQAYGFIKLNNAGSSVIHFSYDMDEGEFNDPPDFENKIRKYNELKKNGTHDEIMELIVDAIERAADKMKIIPGEEVVEWEDETI